MPERVSTTRSIRTPVPTVFNDGDVLYLYHGITEDLGTRGCGEIASMARNDHENPRTNAPSRLTSPTRLPDVTRPPKALVLPKALPTSPGSTGNPPGTRELEQTHANELMGKHDQDDLSKQPELATAPHFDASSTPEGTTSEGARAANTVGMCTCLASTHAGGAVRLPFVHHFTILECSLSMSRLSTCALTLRSTTNQAHIRTRVFSLLATVQLGILGSCWQAECFVGIAPQLVR